MDSNVAKSRNGSSSHGRVRGVILSPQGWQQFQAAKQQAESEETWGKHFTQEYSASGYYAIRFSSCPSPIIAFSFEDVPHSRRKCCI
ncbi:MAG: hypothetical protein HWQ38_17755 [Nostoc sp. NMS7]|uniref:hypothetical protein n=1 Tax=Nostoc sp. NMS7 TaxID=2815391 RepID=UPI0025EF3CBA|nr:hypothetical protein [Nostoc sp. NMS7]MBN3948201.1 hypothetical protein [Nostoc sp. NMS7]